MTKPALCLHVGQHKTGSSAIQNYLFGHRDSLRDVQYLYKDRANASLWMLQAFKRDLGALPTYRHKALSAEHLAKVRSRARRRLQAALAAISEPQAILSAESVSLFTPEEMQDLQAFLSPYFSTITVFQYVRPMKSRLESAFQEKLKHRYAALDDPFKLNYFRRASILADAFGRENLRIFKFDSGLFPRGDVVCHFLAQLGLPLPESSSDTDANLGLSLPAVQLLYAYRLVQRTRTGRDRVIVERLGGLPGPPFRFHSALYREIIASVPRGVSKFEALAGFSLDENVDADDAIAVRNEADLLAIPDVALDWLASELGRPAGAPGTADAKVLAASVAALATGDSPTGPGG
jgi:hypothetical protein